MTSKETQTNQEPFDQARILWQQIASNPNDFLVPSTRFATAFGHGAILLTGNNSLLDQIRARAEQGRVTIAGVEFSLKELDIVGKFYQFLAQKNLKGRCMDERIDESAAHKDSGIHQHCGAAAAIGSLIDKSGEEMENLAMGLTGETEKAELIAGMEEKHEALVIKIDLGDLSTVKPKKYQELRNNAALPFQVSMSLQAVKELAQRENIAPQDIIQALFKWNVLIAVNIINGQHNQYQSDASRHGIIIVLDKRGLTPDLQDLYTSFINNLTGYVNTQKKIETTNIEINKQISKS